MAIKRIGNESREWQRIRSCIRCDNGKVRETRAELERRALSVRGDAIRESAPDL